MDISSYKNHLNKYQRILNLDLNEIEIFFGYKNSFQSLDIKLNIFVI